jgi:hypothetical protein
VGFFGLIDPDAGPGSAPSVDPVSAPGTDNPDPKLSASAARATIALRSLFAIPGSEELHAELGFAPLEALLAVASTLSDPLVDSVRGAAEALSREPDWATVEHRWVAHWDTKPRGIEAPGIPAGQKNLTILRAPPIADMVRRVGLNQTPGHICEPQVYPAPLMQRGGRHHKDSYSKASFPSEPSSRVGVAVMVAAGYPRDQWPDVVCGTSFIHALSGNAA